MGGYISLHNASTAFSDAELAYALPDLQSQVAYLGEFWSHWGLLAYLDINGTGTPIVIVDYPEHGDPGGPLGYHHVDANYQPFAVVFAGLCRDRGKSATSVISHEMLEMLANQQANTLTLVPTGDNTGIIVSQEVCDPCEVSLYYEAPHGTIVSDFALPGWWIPGYPFQVDFLGLIPGPLRLASGGYIPTQTVTLSGPQLIFGDDTDPDVRGASDAMRDELAAGFGARADVLRQLHASRGIVDTRSATLAYAAWDRALSTIPERLQQPATGGLGMTVVRRVHVPTTAA
jgi:hypothetical protein